MIWPFFAIFAAICWAIGNIIDKVVLSKFIRQPMTAVITLGALSLGAVLIVLGCGGFIRFSACQTLLALLAGVTYALMNICYVKAVQLEEISRIIPLFSLSPIMISLVAAITLHEVFSTATYLGIVLILFGAVTLSAQRVERFRFNTAFWLMVGASASITVTEIIQKYLLHYHPYWSVFAYSRLGSFMAIIPVTWIYRHEMLGLIRAKKFGTLGFISASGTLNVIALLSVVYASSLGYVTLVNAITQVQPLIVLTLSVAASLLVPHIFKEEQSMRIFARKFASIATMFVGVLLLLKFQ